MILGAAIDAGAPIGEIQKALDSLHIQGLSLSSRKAQRGGVSGTQVTVGLHGDAKRVTHWNEFTAIVEQSDLPPKVVERATAVLLRLAEAEAMVHGVPVEETRPHELGDMDTLVDVVGSVVGLELLEVQRLYSSPLPSGSGVIKSAHGILPVPSPATSALLAMAKAPVIPAPGGATDTGEMVTPTGAAILTTLATFRQPVMNLTKVGYGLGSRDSQLYPNALALWLGEEIDAKYNTDLTIIETNLDDMSGEMLGYVQERLFDVGALDVWFTPIQMKKNRPATMVSAIVPSILESDAITLVMKETSTLGIRVRPVSRYEAERYNVDVDTSLGTVSVKVKKLDGRNVSVSPEYEECRRIALDRDIPLHEVYRIVQREAEQNLLDQ